MRSLRHRCSAAVIPLCLLALAGCGSGSSEPGTDTFFDQHSAAANRTAIEARTLEGEVARLSTPPTAEQLGRLEVQARRARRFFLPASQWAGPEQGEEEDLGRAETEISEGGDDLLNAAAALRSYSRAPTPAALARYRSQLGIARQHWNEGVTELWFLAHKHGPPLI
ncbi:MAG: hypothetical protein ACLQBB_00155 [Solirubrobacteraceae bacterium]